MSKVKWELQTKNIKDLRDFEKNARKLSVHDAKNLQQSLDKYGLIDKPIVNTDGTIIGGHQRIALLRTQGIQSIECWLPSKKLSNQQVKELNIRLNRNKGEFDWDLLANEFEIEELLDFGFLEAELGISVEEEIAAAEKEDEKVEEENVCPNCGCELPKAKGKRQK